jgi:hypothetical protein
MENSENEISNLDLPVALVIREALSDLPTEVRKELQGTLTEDEFVSVRVDIYLQEIETAMNNGFDELGAKEIALRECLTGLVHDNG